MDEEACKDDGPESERSGTFAKIKDELMQRFVQTYMEQKNELLEHSMPFVDNRPERRRRLRLMQEMLVAKDRLEEEGDIFGLAFVDQGVEAIINGDWKEALAIAELFSYESQSLIIHEMYQEKHAVFRDILHRAAKEALPSDPMDLVVKKGGKWGQSGV